MNSINREITDDEILLLITKYLINNGYIKTEKMLKKEVSLKEIDFGEIAYIKDLKSILNEYIQLKAKELSREEMSHSISLSMGPEVERTFRSLEKLVGDYASYRRMIANQIVQLNEDFELDQSSPPALSNSNPREKDLEQQSNQDNVQTLQDRPIDQLLDDHTPISADPVMMSDLNLPMEQYLHLYRTLPNILPGVINDTLSNNQVLDDSAVNSILDTLEKNPAFSDLRLSDIPFNQSLGDMHKRSASSSQLATPEKESKRSKKD